MTPEEWGSSAVLVREDVMGKFSGVLADTARRFCAVNWGKVTPDGTVDKRPNGFAMAHRTDR